MTSFLRLLRVHRLSSPFQRFSISHESCTTSGCPDQLTPSRSSIMTSVLSEPSTSTRSSTGITDPYKSSIREIFSTMMEVKMNNVSENNKVMVLEETYNVLDIIKMIAFSEGQEDAFYVCDLRDIVRKCKDWSHKMPRIKPFYAIKANDHHVILEIMAALGVGFDCSSAGEISIVKKMNVSSDNIIFAHTIKSKASIRYARNAGIQYMTVDNEMELHKIKDIFPTAKLIIRIKSDTKAAEVTLSNKFGCHPDEEAPMLLKAAARLNLKVVGISFHVGTGCKELESYRRSIIWSRILFDLGASLDHDMYILDIGGGFPGMKGTSIDPFAELINATVEEYFPDPRVTVIAEPGRYFVASAFTLASKILSIRNGNEYYLNDGVYGSFSRPTFEIVPQPLIKNADTVPSGLQLCTLWGPTCDERDCITKSALLPMLSMEDWLYFENMGAYSFVMGSTFNNFAQAQTRVAYFADTITWKLLTNSSHKMKVDFVMDNDSRQQQSE